MDIIHELISSLGTITIMCMTVHIIQAVKSFLKDIHFGEYSLQITLKKIDRQH